MVGKLALSLVIFVCLEEIFLTQGNRDTPVMLSKSFIILPLMCGTPGIDFCVCVR